MKENCKKKLFISGPITDTPFYWRTFEEARDFYEAEGYAVMNPAELPVGMSNADYARICLSMIDSADEVAFLPGWHESVGAKLEHDYCYYIRKPVKLYSDDISHGSRDFLCGLGTDGRCVAGKQEFEDGKCFCSTGCTACVYCHPRVSIHDALHEYFAGRTTKEDAVSNVLDFAVGQALQDGYVVDFAFDKDGWANVTLRPMPMPRLRSKEADE